MRGIKVTICNPLNLHTLLFGIFLILSPKQILAADTINQSPTGQCSPAVAHTQGNVTIHSECNVTITQLQEVAIRLVYQDDDPWLTHDHATLRITNIGTNIFNFTYRIWG